MGSDRQRFSFVPDKVLALCYTFLFFAKSLWEYDAEFPSVFNEYVVSPLVNKENVLAYGRTDDIQAG